MNILETINSSADVKKIPEEQLPQLCSELRKMIIENVSRTGGHLASNLGAVELTVALHRVYDSSKDRIVFDVGHQCYTHKIITGRRDQLHTLRQFNGLSGFPKPYESDDDAFIAGHASDSVAIALGMAKARTIQGADYDVVAVIGDGALTGGLAYEGLENAGVSGEPLVIVLNDNAMSISGNVGSMERVLSKARVRPEYLEFKRNYRATIGRLPRLYNFNHEIKESIKRRVLPSTMFDDFGLYYLGPIDGHDIRQVETALQWAKQMRVPVLLHVLTKKGKGYSFAEQHPEKYHGVGPFDIETGVSDCSKPSYSSVAGETLCEIAQKNSKVVAITAAMSDGTGLDVFSRKFPSRFFDVGIAEGCAVSMAAGMSKQGLTPVFCVYSSFFQRSYDMLLHDIALQNLHVVFCVDRCGLVGSDGETHHGLFDVSYLRTVPGITILCPADFQELKDMIHTAVYQIDGPVAVRYPRGGEPKDYLPSDKEDQVSENSSVTLVSYGNMFWETRKAKNLLKEKGIEADLIRLKTIEPLDISRITESVRRTGRLIIAEETCRSGCIGEAVIAQLAENASVPCSYRLINLGDGIVTHGSVSELMDLYKINSSSIVSAVEELMQSHG